MNVQRKIEAIKSGKIIELRLEWLIYQQQEDPNMYKDPKFLVVLSSTDKKLFSNFIKSLSDVKLHNGSRWVTRRSATIGKLMIKKQDGWEERIDVTFTGFFIGGKRSLDSLFYSPSLARFIFEIIEHCEKEKLFLPEGLLDKLSGNKGA